MQSHAHRDRLLLVAGMPRSGSTWLYNVIRLALEDVIAGAQIWSGWTEDLDRASGERTKLVKLHDFDEILAAEADIIIYSYRDIRDVIASSYRMWGTAPTVEHAQSLVSQFQHWYDRCNVLIRYDELIARPLQIVTRVTAALGIHPDPAKIVERLRPLSSLPPESATDSYHRTTLYHRNHLTHGGHVTWKNDVDAAVIRAIEVRFADWFKRYSYLPVKSDDRIQ